MIHAGIALARLLEAAEGANDAECTAAQFGTAVEPCAGGWLIFAGVDSPLNRAIGMGLEGVAGDDAVDRMEVFFRERGARAAVDLCPLASPELLASLCRRGYRAAEFNNMMVRWLAGANPWPEDPRVRVTSDAERWARAAGMGFFDQTDLTAEEMEVGLSICRAGRTECFLATAENGADTAGAALAVHGTTALLFADSTLAAYRRQGWQQALIRGRLNEALARGCDLAAAVTAPGSTSQRNYERLGFQVAYTKVLLVEG